MELDRNPKSAYGRQGGIRVVDRKAISAVGGKPTRHETGARETDPGTIPQGDFRDQNGSQFSGYLIE